ncbi:MAG: energy-coupling factor transporter transmembrane component T [Oscillospiraceae bacterium]|nr:energy-coupling factor transporter transmembrane component T [Oscillospiraceae bacterium]
MTVSHQKGLDARIGLCLLLLSFIIAVAQSGLLIAGLFIGGIIVLMLRFRLRRTALRLVVIYFLLTGLQLWLIPLLPPGLASLLAVFIYFKMLFPCAAAAALFTGTTSVRALMAGLQKLHVPQPLVVSLAVSVRYFPTLKQDLGSIWQAMRLRQIRVIGQKLECLYVPLLLSAVNTGEALARSALLRGIENPGPKSSLLSVQIDRQDITALLYFALLTMAALLWR